MKKIIDGLTYNTETATELAEVTRRNGNNPMWLTLYQTPKGKLFIECDNHLSFSRDPHGLHAEAQWQEVFSRTLSGSNDVLSLSSAELLNRLGFSVDVIETVLPDLVEAA